MGESSGRVSVNLMQNYKSPRVTVTIRAILVNIHTHTTQHRQTDRHIDSFRLAIQPSCSVS